MFKIVQSSSHFLITPSTSQTRKLSGIVEAGLALAGKKAAEKTGELVAEKSVDAIDPNDKESTESTENHDETSPSTKPSIDSSPKSMKQTLLEASDLLSFTSRQLKRIADRL